MQGRGDWGSRPKSICLGKVILVFLLVTFSKTCAGNDCFYSANNTISLVDLTLAVGDCEDIVLEIRGRVEINSPLYFTRYLNATNLTILGTASGLSELACSSDFPMLSGFMWFVSDLVSLSIHNVTFTGCEGLLQISRVHSVLIESSYFRKTSHFGCVTMHDCEVVKVTNSDFTDCNSTSREITFSDYFVGHSGGLTIVTTDLAVATNIIVAGVTFNHCLSVGSLIEDLSVTDAFIQNRLLGVGGGLGLFFFHFGTKAYQIVIDNTYFTNCTASFFGGGMAIYSYGEVEVDFILKNSTFANNAVKLHNGGGLAIVHIPSASVYESISAVISDSVFTSNAAISGGGVFLVASSAVTSNITFENSTLDSNTGGGVFIMTSNISTSFARPVIVFKDCFFTAGGLNGTVADEDDFLLAVFRVIIVFEGYNVFTNDSGICLYVAQTKVLVRGSLELSYSATALVIPDSSQLVLHRQARIVFKNNNALYGTGFYVGDTSLLSGAAKLLGRTIYNPLCFLQYEDPKVPPALWDNVSLEFVDNVASIASVAFLNTFDFCSWTGSSFQPDKVLLGWKYVTIKNNVNRFYNYSTDKRISVQSLKYVYSANISFPADETNSSLPGSIFPGERFKVNSECWDELGTTTNCALEVLYTVGDSTSDEQIELSHLPFFSSVPSHEMAVSVDLQSRTDVSLPSPLNIQILPLTSTLSIATASQPSASANITLADCPLGFSLNTDIGDCQCNSELPSSRVLKCLRERQLLVMKPGYWANPTKTTKGVPSVEAYLCPYTYCSCEAIGDIELRGDLYSSTCLSVLNPLKPDSVCACNREGLLCGKCKSGGVSTVFSRCLQCGSENGAWIFALVAANVILIPLMLYFLRPPPDLLYPVLFYFQTLPYLLLSRFHPVFEPMLFISHVLSLYFPFDTCLYPGATALHTYALRFTPVILLVPITVILVSLLVRLSLWKSVRNGGWFVFLLMFNHTMYTITSLLNCPRLRNSEGQEKPVWFNDGTVTCFEDVGHVLLALFAISIFVGIGCIFIALLVCYARPKPEWRHMWGFYAQTITPYSADFKWFGAVELIRRTAFIIKSQSSPLDLASTNALLFITFAVYTYCQPYKRKLASVLDVVVLVIMISNVNFFLSVQEVTNVVPMNSSGECRSYFQQDVHLLPLSAYWRISVYIPGVFLVLFFCWEIGIYTRKLCGTLLVKLKQRRQARRMQRFMMLPSAPSNLINEQEFCETDVYAKTPETQKKRYAKGATHSLPRDKKFPSISDSFAVITRTFSFGRNGHYSVLSRSSMNLKMSTVTMNESLLEDNKDFNVDDNKFKDSI